MEAGRFLIAIVVVLFALSLLYFIKIKLNVPPIAVMAGFAIYFVLAIAPAIAEFITTRGISDDTIRTLLTCLPVSILIMLSTSLIIFVINNQITIYEALLAAPFIIIALARGTLAGEISEDFSQIAKQIAASIMIILGYVFALNLNDLLKMGGAWISLYYGTLFVSAYILLLPPEKLSPQSATSFVIISFMAAFLLSTQLTNATKWFVEKFYVEIPSAGATTPVAQPLALVTRMINRMFIITGGTYEFVASGEEPQRGIELAILEHRSYFDPKRKAIVTRSLSELVNPLGILPLSLVYHVDLYKGSAENKTLELIEENLCVADKKKINEESYGNFFIPEGRSRISCTMEIGLDKIYGTEEFNLTGKLYLVFRYTLDGEYSSAAIAPIRLLGEKFAEDLIVYGKEEIVPVEYTMISLRGPVRIGGEITFLSKLPTARAEEPIVINPKLVLEGFSLRGGVTELTKISTFGLLIPPEFDPCAEESVGWWDCRNERGYGEVLGEPIDSAVAELLSKGYTLCLANLTAVNNILAKDRKARVVGVPLPRCTIYFRGRQGPYEIRTYLLAAFTKYRLTEYIDKREVIELEEVQG